MPNSNAYANLVRKKTDGATKPKGKRRKLDDYETPEPDTERLTRFITFNGPVLEPACGSGRMVRVLKRETGLRVIGTDIKTGKNFLDRTAKFKGDIITNPPYGLKQADAFVEHALKLADGKVAMLMELKFLSGSGRGKNLYTLYPPEAIIIIPGRVYFFAGGKQIKSQFYSHCWIVWPERPKRESGGKYHSTKIYWAIDEFE